MLGKFLGKMKEKMKNKKKTGEAELKVQEALAYFSAHKIPPTAEGIRQFTGLPIEDIQSSATFQSACN